MTTGRAFLLALGLILSGIILVESWLDKRVTLVIDGRTSNIKSYASTVGELLGSKGVTLEKGDFLTPAWNDWLREGETIRIERTSRAVILADGKIHQLSSREKLPANLLLHAGIPLFPGDLIFLDGRMIAPDSELPQNPVYAIQLRRAQPITLQYGSSSQSITSNANNLGQALWEAGIDLNAKDTLSKPLDTPLLDALEVSFKPAQEVSIRTSGKTVKTLTNAETVGEVLAESGQPLQGLDYSTPPAGEAIPSDGLIQVVRVDEEILLETATIPFDTETQPVADLEIDQQSVVEEGRLGLIIHRVRVRLEDGEEVSQNLEGEYTALEPQPRILGYGTKVVPHTLDTPDGPITYWRALNMYAVSYNHTSNGGTGTATGIPLAKGVAAVDINYIPFYTQLYIPGYGHAVAADVGGGVQGRMIDLGYSDSDYVSWHQWVTVYFLWPPPETIPWIVP